MRLSLPPWRNLTRSCCSSGIFLCTMPHRHNNLDTSAPILRCEEGANSIDRDAFRKSITVLAAKVPSAKTGSVLKANAMKRMIMNLPKVRNVLPDPHGSEMQSRLVLLRVADKDQLTPEAIEFLNAEGCELLPHAVELDYTYWTVGSSLSFWLVSDKTICGPKDEILQAALPQELCDESPTGFTVIGHIAHLNLNAEYLPYKHVIGQVILDKNTKVRTVINKLGSIHSQFRFFDMELIAGEPDYLVEHHESDCRFTFDFSKVYWNSRLHTEHDRLVKLFVPTEGIIADVFAGVGPFAIPAAKNGCAVMGNDLNPECARWLRQNVSDNQVTDNVRVFCEDGREFIRTVVSKAFHEPFPPFTQWTTRKKQAKEERRLRDQVVLRGEKARSEPVPPAEHAPRNTISHFVMNLPDSAIEFLNAFQGVLSDVSGDLRAVYHTMPMIHCHCFTRYLEPAEAEADIISRVVKSLGYVLEEDVSLHLVRSVAPNKDMYCISFRLPRKVAFR
ncbi:hypothetical protein BD410DRAFT_761443 [Rickenella mellea]|uniref:tRNA (guanine(37)-N1)-methyltransferase n=1 Tax=Rickenella mellea TaxID=50990 RepID=A0A4Y7QL42_9AGAM|nr:hypothetical protein BD410DRAFT_761443 [Rickenella mellea]